MNNRVMLMLLAGVNLLLIALTVLSVDWLPRAMAQRVGGSGNFLMLTSRWDKDEDALILVDLPERRLHVFVPNRERGGQLTLVASRGLEQDFEAATSGRPAGEEKGNKK